jgi:hypothetical protein
MKRETQINKRGEEGAMKRETERHKRGENREQGRYFRGGRGGKYIDRTLEWETLGMTFLF